jgi:hypothetical protein
MSRVTEVQGTLSQAHTGIGIGMPAQKETIKVKSNFDRGQPPAPRYMVLLPVDQGQH